MAIATLSGSPDDSGPGDRPGLVTVPRRRGRAALLAWGIAIALAALALGAPATARAQSAVITEFPAGQSPTHITAGPDGNLWFTELFRSSVGRLTPTGAVDIFTEGITPMPPYSMGGLLDVAAGPDGNVWFTEGVRDKVGLITPAGVVTEFSDGITAGSLTAGIAAGSDGNLWFTENAVNQIGRITPSGVVTEFSDGITLGGAPPGAGLGDITAGPDGNLWFAEPGNRIGRITPAGAVTEFPLGIENGSPGELTAGPDGNVWFTEHGTASGLGTGIGRITPSGVVTFFPVLLPSEAGITNGPDGNLWFVGQDSIGRITPAGVVTLFSAGIRPSSGLRDIAAGPDGNLWFTMQYDNRIGRLTPPGPEPAPVTPSLPAEPPAVPASAPALTVRVVGPRTVTRGKRATFAYRVKNTTTAPITRVVVVNTLPRGLNIDAASRRANLRARKALRFTGGGRKITFRIGTIGKGKTVVVRVNAKVATSAATGRKANTVVVSGRRVAAVRAISNVTIR
jgi:virginiamycin B lyase